MMLIVPCGCCRWEFLTEKLTYERRIRESKLKAALLQVVSSYDEIIDDSALNGDMLLMLYRPAR